jgi:tetratricopeptide (TPR) repeat protein
MKRRVWLLFFLALLGLTLRQDLANLARVQGQARLQAGDVAGAERLRERVLALGSEVTDLDYNLGVAHYRKGAFTLARQRFSEALATAEPGLAAAIHYNLGNTHFRQGEGLARHDTAAAAAHFREAMADYRRVLSLTPRATDADANLRLAQVRYTTLAARAAPGTRRSPERDSGRQGEGGADQGDRRRSESTAVQGKAAPGAAQEAARADASAGAGKARRDLTRSEAERLLNDARGRELAVGLPHVGRHAGQLAGPEKDW